MGASCGRRSSWDRGPGVPTCRSARPGVMGPVSRSVSRTAAAGARGRPPRPGRRPARPRGRARSPRRGRGPRAWRRRSTRGCGRSWATGRAGAVISAFDRPCAMSSRISRSRSVSSGNAAGAARGAGRAKKSISRRATPGPKIASPAATARTARISSARWAPLRSSRGRRRARRATPSVAVVHRQHETATCGRRRRRSAASPRSPSTARHVHVHQDDVRLERAPTAATASSPVAASPTTSRSPAVPSSARQAGAERGVVVGDEDADRAVSVRPAPHGAVAGRPIGRRPRSERPPAGSRPRVAARRRPPAHLRRPRRASTRARCPARAPAGRPRPSSTTSIVELARRPSSRTRHVRAAAWRTAFVIASTAIR